MSKTHVLKFLIVFGILLVAVREPLTAAVTALILMGVDSFFKFLLDVQESGKTG